MALAVHPARAIGRFAEALAAQGADDVDPSWMRSDTRLPVGFLNVRQGSPCHAPCAS